MNTITPAKQRVEYVLKKGLREKKKDQRKEGFGIIMRFILNSYSSVTKTMMTTILTRQQRL